MSNNEPVSPYLSLLHSRLSPTTLHGPHQHLHMQRAQMLDSEIHSLRRALLEASRMRNMSAGPCRLPPELLTQIFEDCQTFWEPEREVYESDSEDDTFLSGWMAITHVCSYWRKVALGASSLWSRPEIDVLSIHPGYIPDIMSRCRGNPIELHLNPESVELADEGIEDDVGLRAWLSPKILSQVKGLTISGTLTLLEYVATCFPQDMTQLRRIYLETDGFDYPDPTLPAQFWDLTTITDLTLSSCVVPLGSPLLSSSLTRLSLNSKGNRIRETSIEMCNVFSRMSRLEQLEMHNAVPQSPPQGLTIELPSSLRNLDIRVTDSEIIRDGLKFVSRLVFSPHCSLGFYIETEESLAKNEEADDTLRRVLRQIALASNHVRAAWNLVLGYNSVTVASTELKAWTPGTRVRLPVTETHDTIINNFSIMEYRWQTRMITGRITPQHDLTDVLAFIHLENLHAVTLTSETIHTITANSLWKSLLAAADIYRIDVEPPHQPISAHFFDLRNALCHRHGQIPSDGTRSQFLFPRLRTLVLRLTVEDRKNTELAISLIDLVRSRAELGVPIHEIMFPSPIPSGAGWDTLRAAVKFTPTELKVMR
ncbi:hypothetical protein PENSPDRAFT_659025 [Peniophora sp. CONT]|nr:hypothetical protein PENSPDRAFT_659025 [Peniophora sp. CONT]